MKKIIFLIFISVLSLTALPVCASSDQIPPVLKNGFDSYQKEGAKAAIEAWTKGSGVEGSREALSQANNFKQIEDFYGKYIGYELVEQNSISERSSVCLIDIFFEKGNVFSKFFLYKKPDGQIVVTTFNFHTNAEAIWPKCSIFQNEK